jgi:hypothetical protein
LSQELSTNFDETDSSRRIRFRQHSNNKPYIKSQWLRKVRRSLAHGARTRSYALDIFSSRQALTDCAQNSVTLQLLDQLVKGKSVDLSLVKVRGRTDRAISERFAMLKKAAAAEVAKVANGGSTSASAASAQQPPRTPASTSKGKAAGK